MRLITCTFIIIVSLFQIKAQPNLTFSSRGIGGGGALFCPSINPADPDEIYVGCDLSALFHSTNGGERWDITHFQQTRGGQFSFVSFTSRDNLLYAINHTSMDGYDQVLPCKSTDNGQHWSTLSGNPDESETAYFLKADYDNPDRLIMSYYCTLYFSNNGGATFTEKYNCKTNDSGIEIGGVFFDGDHIYVGSNDGLIVSDDAGQTFSLKPTTGISEEEQILSFSGARQNGQMRFYALTVSGAWAGYAHGSEYWGAIRGIYSMDNASGIWASAIGNVDINTEFATYIGTSANNINTVYIAGGSDWGDPIVMKSTNGGTSWNHIFNTDNNENIVTGWCGDEGDRGWSYAEAPFGFQVSQSDPDVVAISDYGFLHVTDNGGTSWKQTYLNSLSQNPAAAPTPRLKYYRGNGLENTSAWDVKWVDEDRVFAGFSDIRGIQSDDGGGEWSFIPNITDNSIYKVVSHTDGKIYIATSTVHDMYQSTFLTDARIDNGKGGVYYSQDNGATFSSLHDFGHPVIWLATDPTDVNVLYASVIHSTSGGIYVTKDLNLGTGAHWAKLSDPPGTEGHPFNIRVLKNGALVVSYSGRRDNAGFTTSSGVFYSEDGGLSWQDRSADGMKFWTKDVVIDPFDETESTWYACVFTGWGNSSINGTGGIYRTRDKGVSWNKISDSYRVHSCTFDPVHRGVLYFTTETDGLWYSENIDESTPDFQRVEAYRFSQPVRVFFNPYDPGELCVSSFGYGLMFGTQNIIGTHEEAVANGIRVSPNPCSDYVRINIPGTVSEAYTISIRTTDGRLIFRGTFDNNTASVNTSTFSEGIYFVEVRTSQQIMQSKLIIDK